MGDDWGVDVAEDVQGYIEPAINVVEIPEVKLFGKWSTDEVQVGDISLQDYIACKVRSALHHYSHPFLKFQNLLLYKLGQPACS